MHQKTLKTTSEKINIEFKLFTVQISPFRPASPTAVVHALCALINCTAHQALAAQCVEAAQLLAPCAHATTWS
jgi:hypothetical protein